MPIDPAELTRAVRACRRALITTHETPDGDSVGSEIALYHILTAAGAEAWIINIDPIPPELAFMDTAGLARVFDGRLPDRIDTVFMVDTAAPARVREMAAAIRASGARVFAIDHHVPDAGSFGGLVDPAASSTGELIHNYMAAAGLPLTPAVAGPLFYAVMADTGWLTHANAVPAVMGIAAGLAAAAGIDPSAAHTRLKQTWTEPRFRLWAEVMATLEVRHGRIAIIHCTRAMFNRHPGPRTLAEATENFVDDLKRLAGCEVFILLKEMADRPGFRASLRSRPGVNVRTVAARFGGGGHDLAAGCTLAGLDLASAKAALADAFTAAGTL
jgi:bifunctional oligoribonuclease and PAP phosphatase NrnA